MRGPAFSFRRRELRRAQALSRRRPRFAFPRARCGRAPLHAAASKSRLKPLCWRARRQARSVTGGAPPKSPLWQAVTAQRSVRPHLGAGLPPARNAAVAVPRLLAIVAVFPGRRLVWPRRWLRPGWLPFGSRPQRGPRSVTLAAGRKGAARFTASVTRGTRSTKCSLRPPARDRTKGRARQGPRPALGALHLLHQARQAGKAWRSASSQRRYCARWARSGRHGRRAERGPKSASADAAAQRKAGSPKASRASRDCGQWT